VKLAYVSALFPFAPQEQFFEPEVRRLTDSVDVVLLPLRPPSRINAYPHLKARAVYLPLLSATTLLCAAREFFRGPARAAKAVRDAVFGSPSWRARAVNAICMPKALALADAVRRLGIDHIHATWLTTPSTVAYVASRLTGVPFSITAHAHDIGAENLVEQKVRSARFTRVISERNCASLRAQLSDVAAARCVVSHLGVDLPGAATPPHRNAPRILCTARLCAVKGHSYLLDALAILRDRGHAFSCDLAGDGELRAALAENIERLGLANRVRMLGNVPHAELTSALAAGDYDIAVLSSTEQSDRLDRREGIPVALMEAMAAGLPVVATRTGSIPELVVEGTGLLVEQRSAVAMADALERYVEDEPERRRAGEAGRAFVNAEFASSETTRRLLELLEVEPASRGAVLVPAS
jgi:glycosyltransferase involved in cell wall biosynthesis